MWTIRRAELILALLTGLNFLNYLDRFVLSAVLPRIQSDLGLGHGAAGLLGTVFLIGYFLTSPLFGSLADRGKRTGLVAAGIAVWSIATIASGLATGVVSLALTRALVGVGEASYATIAPTIIDDIAPAGKKSTWLAIFYAATPIGSAFGYLTGGLVEAHFGWRTAFFVAGGPGLLLGILCLFVADPPRHAMATRGPLMATLRPLLKIPLYVRAVLGYAAFTFAIGGFGYWGPTYLFQRFEGTGLTLAAANVWMGGVTVVGGALGTALGGIFGDKLVRVRLSRPDTAAISDAAARSEDASRRVTAYLRLCAVGSAIGAPFAAAAVLAPRASLFCAFFFVCEVAVFLSTSPINAAILESVPPEIRASAMALSIFGIHLLGDLWSPPAVGALADISSMRVAILLLPLAILLSAVVWWPNRPAATA
jgi:MFS family permease